MAESVRKIWKECGITAARIRRTKALARSRGRLVELWCGSTPLIAVYPDGRLKLSGRGLTGSKRRR